ncbi:MAG TPA: DNA cytosine methyltransferase [Candidatus Acidoferrum sp.]|nr:DNA cytosine methyltransferase [Candidatus Acidoferrum sp.]
MTDFTCLELCAGAGGQAIGFERAGFSHVGLVEIEPDACATLRSNRPSWRVIQEDIKKFDGSPYRGVDLLSAGLPCPPFSRAGKQLGHADERNLFPDALRILRECQPRVVMIENVRGILDPAFDYFRLELKETLAKLGYKSAWKLHNASDYGVPQLRPRAILVGVTLNCAAEFSWPRKSFAPPQPVSEVLKDLMLSRGWRGYRQWSKLARTIAPTLVGGSKKHGGPDLGPTRARKAWAQLGVDGLGIANEPPGRDFSGMPKLTLEMTALLQGFPPDWQFCGGKTSAYRQIGNAFPPPVAAAMGRNIQRCLMSKALARAAS